MRRRGNKSTKVPNVKLRPAYPAAGSSRSAAAAMVVEEESCWAEETQSQGFFTNTSDDEDYGDDIYGIMGLGRARSRMLADPCPRPLRGVCICASGVADKPTLFKQAVELGATCTRAFTDRVTHLVATGHGGAKYGCALERKIPILKPTWITENYKIWLRGDDFDFDESIQLHRLPIFSGVVLCPSGITDITTRTRISKLVTAHQGEYVKNLERPVRVTHLLCSGDEETEKMRYAEKFNERGEARIYMVWEEWFWDSLEFGGRFEEERYLVRRGPRPGRKSLTGAGSSSPGHPPPSSEVASQHDECPSSSAEDNPPLPLPGRRQQHFPAPPAQASQPPQQSQHHHPANEQQPQPQDAAETTEDEPAFINVLPAVTLQLWGSLLHRRGYEVSDGEVILSPSKAKANNNAKGKGRAAAGEDDMDVDVDGEQLAPLRLNKGKEREEMKFGAARSVISSFRRVNSFAPALEASSSSLPGAEGPSGGRVLPFRRSKTVSGAVAFGGAPPPAEDAAGPLGRAVSTGDIPGAGPSTSTSNANPAAPPPKQIFAGMKLAALGEARTPTVRSAIEQHGGAWCADEEEEGVDFIVVRLVSGSKLYRAEEDTKMRAKYRTECWLEQCIYADRVCEPEEQISSVPLGIEIPVFGAENILMAISGFDQSEACGLKRLFRALGITFTPTFSRKCTHLLCPSGTGQKYEKAREWGVPVVGREWLMMLCETGEVPVRGVGEVAGGAGEGVEMDVDMPGGGELSTKRKDLKGKGKEVDRMDVDGEAEGNLVDITNVGPSDPVIHAQRDLASAVMKKAKKPPTQPQGPPPPRTHAIEPVSFGAPRLLTKSYSTSSSSIGTGNAKGNVVSSSVSPSGSQPSSSARRLEKEREEREESFVKHALDGMGGMEIDETGSAPQERKDLSRGERVPSSASPEPMKLVRTDTEFVDDRDRDPHDDESGHGDGDGGRQKSESPVKVAKVLTRALKDSIVSLLGKRMRGLGEGDEDEGEEEEGEEGADVPMEFEAQEGEEEEGDDVVIPDSEAGGEVLERKESLKAATATTPRTMTRTRSKLGLSASRTKPKRSRTESRTTSERDLTAAFRAAEKALVSASASGSGDAEVGEVELEEAGEAASAAGPSTPVRVGSSPAHGASTTKRKANAKAKKARVGVGVGSGSVRMTRASARLLQESQAESQMEVEESQGDVEGEMEESQGTSVSASQAPAQAQGKRRKRAPSTTTVLTTATATTTTTITTTNTATTAKGKGKVHVEYEDPYENEERSKLLDMLAAREREREAGLLLAASASALGSVLGSTLGSAAGSGTPGAKTTSTKAVVGRRAEENDEIVVLSETMGTVQEQESSIRDESLLQSVNLRTNASGVVRRRSSRIVG
ncbi:hypothetical protein D9613_008021 [Agrocybe pediades]|uniref:BRCT domain-containing protein n=1 Tax=Agrocybe pediades TaxID=84607 RepID=A0A8H4QN50_9AGAR|nr:hypothetical protein D9613_008021 [Agrocybe pediades]